MLSKALVGVVGKEGRSSGARRQGAAAQHGHANGRGRFNCVPRSAAALQSGSRSLCRRAASRPGASECHHAGRRGLRERGRLSCPLHRATKALHGAGRCRRHVGQPCSTAELRLSSARALGADNARAGAAEARGTCAPLRLSGGGLQDGAAQHGCGRVNDLDGSADAEGSAAEPGLDTVEDGCATGEHSGAAYATCAAGRARGGVQRLGALSGHKGRRSRTPALGHVALESCELDRPVNRNGLG
mmetsp:Transcript_24062/g.62517  ORF Transcript_24062/g.62517 Transcript_24062/m.62517 type:complete len:244 (-) Transcript_24062:408-1139(-)